MAPGRAVETRQHDIQVPALVVAADSGERAVRGRVRIVHIEIRRQHVGGPDAAIAANRHPGELAPGANVLDGEEGAAIPENRRPYSLR
jgi:hypothetical protein